MISGAQKSVDGNLSFAEDHGLKSVPSGKTNDRQDDLRQSGRPNQAIGPAGIQ